MSTSRKSVASSPRPPQVTVIVPVKDRESLLRGLLDALDTQTYTDFETIVVDDGSTDGSGETARSRVVAGRKVRVLDGGGKGAVAARTLGVERSKGAILAFTDSDCTPRADWLQRGVAAINSGADAANGRTVPARPMLPLERSMGSGLEGLFPTCNMFYRREAFARAGGFDAGIGIAWGFPRKNRAKGLGFGEDTVLGWRVARTGKMAYASQAIVEHHVFPPDWSDMISRMVGVGAFPAMVREVPELRGTLCWYRVQLGPRSRIPVYATAAALITRQRPLVAAAIIAWAAMRYSDMNQDHIPKRRRLTALPAEMTSDVIMAAALLGGSARARTLLI